MQTKDITDMKYVSVDVFSFSIKLISFTSVGISVNL